MPAGGPRRAARQLLVSLAVERAGADGSGDATMVGERRRRLITVAGIVSTRLLERRGSLSTSGFFSVFGRSPQKIEIHVHKSGGGKM